MSMRTELETIEKQVKAAGHPVAELLRRAEVDASMWQRWKAGKQKPLLESWRKVETAFREMVQ
jgi:hypothetical protein